MLDAQLDDGDPDDQGLEAQRFVDDDLDGRADLPMPRVSSRIR
jgi:hypothetical protein